MRKAPPSPALTFRSIIRLNSSIQASLPVSLAGLARESARGDIALVDPTNEPGWDAALAQHDEAGVFHTAGWAAALKATYPHEPVYLRSGAGAGASILPMMEVRSWLTGCRGVCLPFTDACGAIEGHRALSFEQVHSIARRRSWKHIEFRGAANLPEEAVPATQFLGHELDLTPGERKVAQRFHPSVRRAIRKAEASGLTVELGTSVAAVQSYYELHLRTRQRHGVPPQPWSFFQNVHRHLLSEKRGFVALAKQGNTAVAGAVFLHYGRKAIYKYGAADRQFQELRPSNLVMATAIRHFAERGFESLHFGRTSAASEGLRRFKLGWGTREETLPYFRYEVRGGRWVTVTDRAVGKLNRIFGRMPLAVNRLVGALLYPHLD